jgi:hypothetical protein
MKSIRHCLVLLASVCGGAPAQAQAQAPSPIVTAQIALPNKSATEMPIPLRWAGRLFFKTDEGDSTCSAQFIRPTVIVTAAHCVRDRSGKFYTDFQFVLQYRLGSYAKKYGYICALTHKNWADTKLSTSARYRWDYAFILLKEPTISGHFGWRFGWAAGQYDKAVKIGYPSGMVGGGDIQIERGPLAYPIESPGIIRLDHGNPRSDQGSSGGAWVAGYGETAQSENLIVSVTSHSRNGRMEIDYGPYFDQDFADLLQAAERGCK